MHGMPGLATQKGRPDAVFWSIMQQRSRPFWTRLRHASLNSSGRARVAVVSKIPAP